MDFSNVLLAAAGLQSGYSPASDGGVPANGLKRKASAIEASPNTKRAVGARQASRRTYIERENEESENDLISEPDFDALSPSFEFAEPEPVALPLNQVSLETFLNNQNPGLGTSAAPFLAKFGITSQSQFSRFRTVDWFLEFFETRLKGKGLSELDEFLLFKTVSSYLA